MNFLVTVYRCNINVAFVLQMWRAESLKAGVGSRSKAAKPPPPTLVCLLPCCERVVSERCSSGRKRGGGDGGSVLSPWEPKTWCNRCRPSCRALASPASLSCYPKVPAPHLPSLTVLSVAPLSLWCQTPVQSLTRPRSAWHPGRFTTVLWVGECFACFESCSSPHLSPHDAPRVVCKGDCWVSPTGEKRCCFQAAYCCRSAAWLRCSAEILPPFSFPRPRM